MKSSRARAGCTLALVLCSACASDVDTEDLDTATAATASDEGAVAEARTRDPGGLWASCQPAWPLPVRVGSTIAEPTSGFRTGCNPGLICMAVPGTTGVCTRLCDATQVKRCGSGVVYQPNVEGRAVCSALGGTCRSRLASRACVNGITPVYIHDCEW